MPLTTITVDNDYGYVILAAASTFLVNIAHQFNTGKYRKAVGLAYPAPYATNEAASKDLAAYRFNCAQRAHANLIENHSTLVTALLISGLRYPIYAAVMGAGWSISRYIYMVGYSTGDLNSKGKGRYYGAVHTLFQFGLFATTFMVGYKLLTGQ